MSDKSATLRGYAAHELRQSRTDLSKDGQKKKLKRAASYKALAQNEEWLDGEKSKSHSRTGKKH